VYYWTKYIRKSVTIITGFASSVVENYAEGAGGTVVVENVLTEPFVGHSKPRIKSYEMCNKFICDYYHFTGFKKPWMTRPPEDIASDEHKNDSPQHIWWHTLHELNSELQMMGLNFSSFGPAQKPPLGMYANFKEVDERVKRRSESQRHRD